MQGAWVPFLVRELDLRPQLRPAQQINKYFFKRTPSGTENSGRRKLKISIKVIYIIIEKAVIIMHPQTGFRKNSRELKNMITNIKMQ